MDLLTDDGKPLASADRSFAIDPAQQFPTLDATAWQQIVLRIVVEQQDGTQLKESTPLTVTVRPAALVGQRIAVVNYPLNTFKPLDILDAKDTSAAISQTLLQQHEWLPVLTVGDAPIYKSSVNEAGNLNPNPATGFPGAAVAGAAQQAADLFDNPDKLTPKAAGIFTAEWLEFEVHSPGRPNHTVRRAVFDLIGPTARAAAKMLDNPIVEALRFDRALGLSGQTDLVILGSQWSAAFAEHLGNEAMLEACQKSTDLLAANAKHDRRKVADQISGMSPIAAPLMVWALARQNWSRYQERIYLDGPNIAAYHRLVIRDEQGKLGLRSAIDIIENHVGVRDGDTDAAAVRLEQGVVDTNAEALAMPTRGVGTAEAFNSAIAQGQQWQTISSTRDPKWQGLALSAELRARVAKDLDAGYAVVVSATPSMINGKPVDCWWRIDPVTGDTLGMTPNGGSVVEDTFMIRLMVTAWVGTTNLLGCMGTSKDTPGGKALGCAICAAIVSVLFWLAISGAYAAGGATAKWASGGNGTAAGGMLGGVCSIYGAAA